MKGFRYRAIDAEGQAVRARVWAKDEVEARGMAQARAHWLLSLEPMSEQQAVRLPLADRQRVLVAMASYLRAGAAVSEAVEALTATNNVRVLESVRDVGEQVSLGQPLSAALRRGGILTVMDEEMVRVGEEGGGLAPALELAAERATREVALRAQLRAALTYPVLLIGMAAICFLVIGLVVLPRLASLVRELGVELTGLPRYALQVSSLMADHTVAVVASLIVVPATIVLTFRLPSARAWIYGSVVQLPGVRGVRRLYVGAVHARAVATLLAGRVPLDRACEIIAGGAEAHTWRYCVALLVEGASPSAAVRQSGALPGAAVAWLQLGERTGELAEAFSHAANDLELSVRGRLDRALTLLQPVLVVLIAAGIASTGMLVMQTLYAIRPGMP